jgi:hypothetical protein
LGLGSDVVNGFDFDGAFGELLKGSHEVGLMTFVVGGNVGVVIEVSIFDHEKAFVAKDARFATLFDYFR